ncbi:DUF262 domain-containing protein [Acidobacteria bacterium AH-259-O06]|nr:DUF262 domain-containing protein [Acidobacteria bacterium AH-259-O06]
MEAGSIIVNREYQRSSKVWPPAARSYLIDTILSSFPMPKISLYQKTDLRSRKTIKEIVDGQQRSQAIYDFFNNTLRITGPSRWAGKRFLDLEEPDQQRFIEYQIDADLFVAATDDEIRQMFRRINSYTVPLNPEEQRHATHQGAFKWFVVGETEKYASTLKQIGVFKERALSRMADAKLITELCLALSSGMETYSKKKLDNFYRVHEVEFPSQERMSAYFATGFGVISEWHDLHGGALMKPANLYSLFLAVIHMREPISVFESVFSASSFVRGSEEILLANLTALSAALEADSAPLSFRGFFDASDQATNTKRNRETRFRWLCRAHGSELIE